MGESETEVTASTSDEYIPEEKTTESEEHHEDDNDEEVDVPKSNRKCPSCDETFVGHYRWLKHVESAHGPRHNCPVHNCYYRTAHKWYMKKHLEQTHGKNAIRCTVEGCQGFFVKRCMKKHLATAHKPKLDNNITAKLKKAMNQCEYCCYKSSKAKEFEAHVKDYHLVGFKCPVEECEETYFVDKIDLHFKALHPRRKYRYKLGKGLKVYDEDIQVNEDAITESATEKEDDELAYVTKDKASTSDFKCLKCKKQFRNCYNLIRHTAIVHEKRYKPTVRTKKFQCPFDGCDKSFTTQGLLKDHENSHSGNYEYKCQFCGQEFFARNRYAVHLKKYHLISIKDITVGTLPAQSVGA